MLRTPFPMVFVLALLVFALATCAGQPAPVRHQDKTSEALPSPATEEASGMFSFSGYRWYVKSSDSPIGPGPNRFSSRPDDVWVDEHGRLHLRVAARDGHWYSTEVFSVAAMGYGRYTFTLSSRVDTLDPHIVLGLFTYADASAFHHREIDIEIARWGQEEIANGQYVVQPWDQDGNLHRFDIALNGPYSTHTFDWQPERVAFESFHGRANEPPPRFPIASWVYRGADIPPAGGARVHLNLWLFNGEPPTDGHEAEVIVESFTFEPAGT